MISKKKQKKNKLSHNSKTILISFIALIVILVLVFLFRGWFRATVIPKTLGIFYSNGVVDTHKREVGDLSNPFESLGFIVPKISHTCNLQQAQSIHVEIDCSTNQEGYTKLPTSPAGVANIQKQASILQATLKSQGWQGGGNGITLTSLINGTAHGIDYSPDAFYQKVIGNTNCIFDTMISYSNPQPPAIRTSFSCSRTINFLGTPKNEIYNSSKAL